MRRPWNIINTPVYSLATHVDGIVNMNICTYVTPISLKPKQYAIAVYHNTKTRENIMEGAGAVLQLLSLSQMSLVSVLGKKSGYHFDKHSHLRKNELTCTWKGLEVLKDACAYLELEFLKKLDDCGGDHDLWVSQVVASKTLREDDILMFQDLIKEGIIL